MNVLVLGSGGREHALAWKISQSPKCDALYVAPGNPGTASVATNVNIQPNDFEALKQHCLSNSVDLVVVGPEAPLVAGVHDFFEGDSKLTHIPVIGPKKAAAQMEGSKAFAKAFMERHDIPTAGYREFTGEEVEAGLDYLQSCKLPIVLKADGLAAGKGVLICETHDDAQQEFKAMLSGKFGDAGSRVVVEDFLRGIELSVFAIVDGADYVLLPTSKDYKRVGEGDSGLNTGGMGAVSPVPFASEELMSKVRERVVQPTIDGLQKDNLPYRGFLYFGLMSVDGNPFVIEYNCRMGDPETQAVLPLIDGDLLELLYAAGTGNLGGRTAELKSGSAATIILASGGYPEAYEKGKSISGADQESDCVVFHAGTRMADNQLQTSGGRVIAVTGFGNDKDEALKQAYSCAEKIEFEGRYFRKDIGFDL